MNLCMLTIIIPTALEDVVIDWMLEQSDIMGFNSSSIYGHGSDETNMSIAELVTGKSKRVMFQTHVPENIAKNILTRLKKTFASRDIHYMIRPLIDAGNLMSYEDE
ncbi:MAG: DUF3240 family protein [Emcibacteraceae bacterium]|nr:DUF3240 family protein [Emcibacteraceae bacterium]